MKRETPYKYVLALYLSDVLGVLLSLVLAGWARQILPYGQPLGARGLGLTPSIYLMVVVIWTVTLRLFAAYDTNRILRFAHEVSTVLSASFVATMLLAGALYLSYRSLSRLLFVYFFVLEFVVLVVLRLAVRLAFQMLKAERTTEQRILLVGAGEVGCQMAALLAERSWMGLRVVGFLDDDPSKVGQVVSGFPVLGPLEEARLVVERHGIHEVIITLPLHAHKRLGRLASVLNEMPVNVRVVPDFFPLAYLRTAVGMLGDMPLITLKEPAITGVTLAAKRTMDLVLAALALLLMWPFLLLIALWIKLDSDGPALFKQERVGLDGQRFWIYKFRTMTVGAERDMTAIMETTEGGRSVMHKDRSDSRITRAGRHLRRWSLDELPQLLNVIKGEMSLVGPRPEMPFMVAEYDSGQRKRLSVLPGITGWWQVTERADQPLALAAEADLYYVNNYSLLLDLQIMLRTLGAVINGKGAY
ncbi:MAG TPA: sugar transferase [Anaerolineae bacterium]|nr:sugar transferase [Anaerolineae bacterium]